eukprot:6203423-Pleurochrysis_carterae.AAC.2
MAVLAAVSIASPMSHIAMHARKPLKPVASESAPIALAEVKPPTMMTRRWPRASARAPPKGALMSPSAAMPEKIVPSSVAPAPRMSCACTGTIVIHSEKPMTKANLTARSARCRESSSSSRYEASASDSGLDAGRFRPSWICSGLSCGRNVYRGTSANIERPTRRNGRRTPPASAILPPMAGPGMCARTVSA